jgi:Mrp family chromosome partitioning ATPase
MTTTNQAFIKVYRQDAAELVPSGPIIAQPRAVPIAALHQSVEFVAATDMGAAQNLAGGALMATSIDVLPPPAVIPVASPVRSSTERRNPGTPARHSQPGPRRVDPATTATRPLSAYIGPRRSAQAVSEHRVGSGLSPGTTVASFRWPAVCRSLAHQCAAELNAVLNRVMSTATQRSPIVGTLGLFAGSGSTTTALCLAARLAARRCRALLVDGDVASPGLARSLDVVPTVGWLESLADESLLADAIVHSVEDQLDLLAQSPGRADDVLNLIAGPKTGRTAARLRQAYQLVLVDLGAFFDPGSQPLALELVRQMEIDAVLAVAAPGGADPRDLATVAEYLGLSGCELLGVVENRTAKPQAVGAKPQAAGARPQAVGAKPQAEGARPQAAIGIIES